VGQLLILESLVAGKLVFRFRRVLVAGRASENYKIYREKTTFFLLPEQVFDQR